MPLEDGYFEGLKSDFADMKNTGPRFGGAITAALFLQKFIQKARGVAGGRGVARRWTGRTWTSRGRPGRRRPRASTAWVARAPWRGGAGAAVVRQVRTLTDFVCKL